MFTEPMHGPVAWSIFWIWLGFIAVGAAAYLVYRLLRPWLKPSGVQAIQRTPAGYFGGADPRREGVVLGD